LLLLIAVVVKNVLSKVTLLSEDCRKCFTVYRLYTRRHDIYKYSTWD